MSFSLFGLRPGFLQVPKAVLDQNGCKSPYFAIARPWGSGQPKRKVADNHPGYPVTFFPFPDPLHREFAVFRFRPGPGISQSAKGQDPGPKWPKITIVCDFPPVGVWPAKALEEEKLRTTTPDTVVTFVSHFGPPSTGKLRFSVFGPVPGFLSVPRALLGQDGRQSYFPIVFRVSPPVGVWSVKI